MMVPAASCLTCSPPATLLLLSFVAACRACATVYACVRVYGGTLCECDARVVTAGDPHITALLYSAACPSDIENACSHRSCRRVHAPAFILWLRHTSLRRCKSACAPRVAKILARPGAGTPPVRHDGGMTLQYRDGVGDCKKTTPGAAPQRPARGGNHV